MARPLTIVYPGAFYHIAARDDERKAVFRRNIATLFSHWPDRNHGPLKDAVWPVLLGRPDRMDG